MSRTPGLLCKSGADAVVVSNHGGRQLDGAASSISMLPKIADAIGSDMEIMFDGGIRSGQDLIRALALGAKSCMIGRAYIYGLGAMGGPGVSKAIDIIRKELDITMALTGVTKDRRYRSPCAGDRETVPSLTCLWRAKVGLIQPAPFDDTTSENLER